MAYIYALGDPRNEKVRYVGQTKYRQQRYKQHLSLAFSANRALAWWIATLEVDGFLPTFTILEEDVSFEQRYIREAYWITYYIRLGHPLLNKAIPKEAKDALFTRDELALLESLGTQRGLRWKELLSLTQLEREAFFPAYQSLIKKGYLIDLEDGRFLRSKKPLPPYVLPLIMEEETNTSDEP